MPFKHFLDETIVERAIEYSKTDLRFFMLDLFLGETCNLYCKHCYFGEHKPISSLLNYEQWISIIDDFLDYGCRHFHISGKESLLTSHTYDVIRYLVKVKEKYKNIFWGIITNGTSLNFEEYNEILDCPIDYLEISVDGDEYFHDYIRGVGTYEKITNTLLKLHNLSKINISYTISGLNYKDFENVVKKLYNLGVKKFYCSPIQMKGRAIYNQIPIINSNQYFETIEEIIKCVCVNNFQHTNFRFSIPHIYVEDMLKMKLYHNKIKEYFQFGKNIFFKVGSNTIEFSLHTISIPLFTQASITSDGNVLSSSDKVGDINNFGKYSNILDFMKTRETSVLKYFSTYERN